eukprot:CAMPEP_0206454612 /NCGR_PEP_ID=MMETSP0324_2-20121206/21238_1 /ASSEMBLY_ACC=CAM_ASM_000836 /TAXON_ID=2866 /ORGANISM="Crypthecodinium cohnii, Strain Seligo" /LENGTH=42 /DNA_ID= /DNA_START= /DNA_END= /DNA_ORIENTATION=
MYATSFAAKKPAAAVTFTKATPRLKTFFGATSVRYVVTVAIS